ncbi:hypothetical protein AB0K43_20225 [Kitasatospora sp. NPDC049258]|uniref:hypothetical protein n=1 Tax=Kitasatospora sp. NPDC049258 TaxID=3155394 RepID=UPI00343F188C
MRYRPALTAAKATVVLAALPALLLAGEAGLALGEGGPAPVVGDRGDDGITLAPGPLPGRADTVARSGSATGLTVLTAEGSGLRLHAAGAGASRAADGAAVVGMPADGADDQEWLVGPAENGELLLRSALLSSDDSGPLVLTTDPDDSVYLQHERAGERAEGQLWTFVDDPAQPAGGRFRILGHRGGCLLDQGYGERLVVGQCEDPRAWWSGRLPDRRPVNPGLTVTP